MANPAYAPTFPAWSGATPAAGHPNADQVEECLTNQLGSAAGGPETYPVKLGADHGSWQCRDMGTIHQSMGISIATFDKVVMMAAAKRAGLGVAGDHGVSACAVRNGSTP